MTGKRGGRPQIEVRLRRLSSRFKKLVSISAHQSLIGSLVRHGVAAGVEHSCTLAQLGDCATVVDVGANRGQFALIVRDRIPTARIESFEPLPEPARRFRTVFAQDSMVTLHPVAIGPRRERATIHISARDDSSSLLPIAAAQSSLFAGTEEAGIATIEVGPLDAFLDAKAIRAPALLKIDVQGFELQALEGCASCIDLFEWVYVECSFVELYEGQAFADEVIAWLRERGLKLRGVYNMAYDARGAAVQADFLFGRQ